MTVAPEKGLQCEADRISNRLAELVTTLVEVFDVQGRGVYNCAIAGLIIAHNVCGARRYSRQLPFCPLQYYTHSSIER